MSSIANDEIDLQRVIANTIRFFQHNFRIIFISTILGISAGLVFYFIAPRRYESQMIVMSDILTESYSDRLTQSLDRLIQEENHSVLSQRLGLTVQEAEAIKAIKIESVKKEFSIDKEDQSTFIVTAEITDKSLLPKLQDGLIEYLRNNEYVKKRVQLREQTYRLLGAKYDEELRSLDSLKEKLFLGKPVASKGSSVTEMMLVDPAEIYSKIIELTRERINNQNALELFNSIQVIEGFTPFEKPTFPTLPLALAIGFALGFFGAIGTLIMKLIYKLTMESDAPAS